MTDAAVREGRHDDPVPPAPASRLIGRTDEIVELRRRIREVRLLTVTGAPGVGKSRLAAALLDAERRGGSRRVVTVDLCAPGAAPAPRQVLAQLQGGEIVLLLDNCDRALEDWGPVVMGLLTRMPSLRILTTSREAWRLPGEAVHPVAGLATDPPGALRPAGGGAYRLFVERLTAAAPDVRPDARDAADIAWICDWSAGLPLALELAAQASATTSVAEVRRALAKGLDPLDRPGPSADPRHVTWDTAVRWTYDALARPERTVLRWLSVLPPGFDRTAAAAVCPPDSLVAGMVPRVLVRLEAKSLLVAELDRPDGSTRFAVPTPVRTFARLRLDEADEQPAVMGRLADRLAPAAARLRRDPVPHPALVRLLAPHRPVVHCVLSWLVATGDERATGLAAVLAVDPLRPDGARADLDLLLRILGAAAPTSAGSTPALEGALSLAFWHGHPSVALLLVGEAVAAARNSDPTTLARVQLLAGLVRERYGDRRQARRDLQAALGVARTSGGAVLTTLCSLHLARHLLDDGQRDDAARAVTRTLPEVREAATAGHLGLALTTAGAVALARGDVAGATALFTERLHATGTTSPDAYDAVAGLALCASRSHRDEDALRLMAAADRPDHPFGLFPAWRDQLHDARDRILRSLPRARATAALRAGQGLAADHAATPVPAGGPDPARPGVAELTTREWEVAQLVMKGLSNQQIADRTTLSVRTVESHIRNIRTVLGLRSRAHMAAWAARHSSGPLA